MGDSFGEKLRSLAKLYYVTGYAQAVLFVILFGIYFGKASEFASSEGLSFKCQTSSTVTSSTVTSSPVQRHHCLNVFNKGENLIQGDSAIRSCNTFIPLLIWIVFAIWLEYRFKKQHTRETHCFHLSQIYLTQLLARIGVFLSFIVVYIIKFDRIVVASIFDCPFMDLDLSVQKNSTRIKCADGDAAKKTSINWAFFALNIIFAVIGTLEFIYLSCIYYCCDVKKKPCSCKDLEGCKQIGSCRKCNTFAAHVLNLERKTDNAAVSRQSGGSESDSDSDSGPSGASNKREDIRINVGSGGIFS